MRGGAFIDLSRKVQALAFEKREWLIGLIRHVLLLVYNIQNGAENADTMCLS